MADPPIAHSNGPVHSANGNAAPAPDPANLESDEHTIHTSPTTAKKRTLSPEPTNHRIDDRDSKRRKGTVPIKPEYLIHDDTAEKEPPTVNDDDAEASHHKDRQPSGSNARKREKNQGQNKARKFGSSKDEVGLCSSRVKAPEFSPEECSFGEKCRFEHDLRRYLKEHKREDLKTFDGVCPVWQASGVCDVGWKCRFVGSHSKEIPHDSGRMELVLVEGDKNGTKIAVKEEIGSVVNSIDVKDRILLTKKKFPTPKSDNYLAWMNEQTDKADRRKARQAKDKAQNGTKTEDRNSSSPEPSSDTRAKPFHEVPNPKIDVSGSIVVDEERVTYTPTPLLPSEKRRLYFGPDTPVLAPLTTQGNLPFRRLCASLGATFTYSEMAMSFPLLNGHKPEWALIKAHESELHPPTFTTKSIPDLLARQSNIVYDYNHSTDLRFSAQISASKPWTALKATEVLTTLLPGRLRCIDLNVGCPIDLVYREGAGSALMDSPAKLEKMLRGMNCVSGRVPITCKIRMGTRDKVPTAQKLVERLVLGSATAGTDWTPSGVAAITLHGRSRQQRYTRQADWEYIDDTAELIQNLNAQTDAVTDTIRAPDDRDLPNGQGLNTPTHSSGKAHGAPVFFLGNGDVYSHTHYNAHFTRTAHPVDAVMLARGALIKPWLFEEIRTQQSLDKSAAERLRYIEAFARFGLDAWGADEVGVGTTRRFLLEWLSFAHRYVPLGLLEVLPAELNERPPRYRGRDELETLLASPDHRDWLRLSELFLGPAHRDFRFEPKHKSNSYEIVAEG